MSLRAPIEQREGEGVPPPGPPDKPPSSGALGILLCSVAVIALIAGLGYGYGRLRGPSYGPAPDLPPPGETTVPAPTTPTTAADPDAARKAEVIAAYRAAWDAHVAVGSDPKATPEDARLSAHITGDSLAVVQRSLAKRKASNEVFVGDFRLHPVVVELAGDRARIRDCVDDATGTVDSRTGAVVEPARRVVTTVTVTMKLVDGVWKQDTYRDEKVACTPGAS